MGETSQRDASVKRVQVVVLNRRCN